MEPSEPEKVLKPKAKAKQGAKPKTPKTTTPATKSNAAKGGKDKGKKSTSSTRRKGKGTDEDAEEQAPDATDAEEAIPEPARKRRTKKLSK